MTKWRLTNKAPICLDIHAVFSNNAYSRLLSKGVSKIVTTNSIPHESKSIDTSSLLASPYSGICRRQFLNRFSGLLNTFKKIYQTRWSGAAGCFTVIDVSKFRWKYLMNIAFGSHLLQVQIIRQSDVYH